MDKSRKSVGFSYVGACQQLMRFYMFTSLWVSRIVRRAQVPPAPKGIVEQSLLNLCQFFTTNNRLPLLARGPLASRSANRIGKDQVKGVLLLPTTNHSSAAATSGGQPVIRSYERGLFL